MNNSLITPIAVILMAGSVYLPAQQSPDCDRLKDISDTVLIGSKFVYGEPLISGLLFGTDKNKYTTIANNEFNCGQALWYAAWGGWNSRHSFNFTGLNPVVNWMHTNDKKVKVHMIVGDDQYLPDWFKTASWTNSQLDTILKDIIDSLMITNDNKTKVDVWNVANELFDWYGNYHSMKWNQMGWEPDQSGLTGADKINTQHPVFIRKAFQYCRQYTNKELELRDCTIENGSAAVGWDRKHKAFYQLVKHMLNSGIPLDAVGYQCHYDIGNTDPILANDELEKGIRRFKALGLDVNITELDIGDKSKIWTDAKAQQQRVDYYNVITHALKGGIDEIQIWEFRDGEPYWRKYENHLLFDTAYNVKPSYYGVQQAFYDFFGYSVAQQPFVTVPTLPAKIEVENYDIGCGSRAYSDIDPVNHGDSGYRADAVDIFKITTSNYIIGYNGPGEWRDYTINIPAGTYRMNAYLATPHTNCKLGLKIYENADEKKLLFSDSVSFKGTTDYNKYDTVSIGNIKIAASGNNRMMKLTTLGNYFNFDWVEFVKETQVIPQGSSDADNDISIFPNPATDHIIISNLQGNGQIRIFDLSGKCIITRDYSTEILHISLDGITGNALIVKVISEAGNTDIVKMVIRQ